MPSKAVQKRRIDAELKRLKIKRDAAVRLRAEKIANKIKWSIARHAVLGAIVPLVGTAVATMWDAMDLADLVMVSIQPKQWCDNAALLTLIFSGLRPYQISQIKSMHYSRRQMLLTPGIPRVQVNSS